MCFNLASEEFNNMSREEVFEQCLRMKPIFVVIESKLEKSASDDICKNQQGSMKYSSGFEGIASRATPHKFWRS